MTLLHQISGRVIGFLTYFTRQEENEAWKQEKRTGAAAMIYEVGYESTKTIPYAVLSE